ncbi:unnamed protein product [Leptosia nina]|uniref:Uncharacterized protein n=1 Tax=Leptosia nina TaxID=320188 RepID=A0AAV1J9P2_9NEOP
MLMLMYMKLKPMIHANTLKVAKHPYLVGVQTPNLECAPSRQASKSTEVQLASSAVRQFILSTLCLSAAAT